MIDFILLLLVSFCFTGFCWFYQIITWYLCDHELLLSFSYVTDWFSHVFEIMNRWTNSLLWQSLLQTDQRERVYSIAWKSLNQDVSALASPLSSSSSSNPKRFTSFSLSVYKWLDFSDSVICSGWVPWGPLVSAFCWSVVSSQFDAEDGSESENEHLWKLI